MDHQSIEEPARQEDGQLETTAAAAAAAAAILKVISTSIKRSSSTDDRSLQQHYQIHCCGQCFACHHQQESRRRPMMRCTRCKVVSYCDRDCQQLHYKRMHKKACLGLDKLRKEKEKQQQQQQHQQESSSGDDSSDHNLLLLYNLQLEIADWIFQMAYRSSDTIAHGAYMFQVAMENYMEAMEMLLQALQDGGSGTSSSSLLLPPVLQRHIDHLRLLLVVLGYSSEYLHTLRESCQDQDTSNAESTAMDPSRLIPNKPIFGVHTPAAQMSLLLFRLHYLAKRRSSSVWNEPKSTDNLIVEYQHQPLFLDENIQQQQQQQVRQQLRDPHWRTLWKSFFQRGNHYDQDAMTYKWGPAALAWDCDDGDHHHRQWSPPRDFYLWLQDFCFFDPDMSQVIEEIVEPIMSSWDSKEENGDRSV
jgi:hypothetical protein